MGNSLGFIEVVGMLGAIEACDTAVKAANVELVGCELTKGGGMVTITLKGKVGAVKAAVDAAVASVERIALVVSHTVIARPSKELEKINQKNSFETKRKKNKEKKEPENKNNEIKEEIITEKLLTEDKKILETKASPIKIPEVNIPVEKTKVEEKIKTTTTTVVEMPTKITSTKPTKITGKIQKPIKVRKK